MLRQAHPRTYQWHDFHTSRGGDVLTGVPIPRKLIGCIEQAICAMGRRFFGTQHSTFTGYITRLRGYVGAPDDLVHYHNRPNSADERATAAEQPTGHGRNYMEENPLMWRETVGGGRRRKGGWAAP